MLCPECGHTEDKVLETRVSKKKDIIRRRRECTACGVRFNTQEELIRTDFVVIKADGRREDLNLQKIRNGLQVACHKRPVTSSQLDKAMENIKLNIEKSFDREVPSQRIGELLMENLKAIDEVAYVRFASVYRKFEHADEFIEEIKGLQSQ